METLVNGESKKEDRRNLEILLETYGLLLREFMERILNTASIARGTTDKWIVSGFEAYNVDAFLKDLEEYKQSEEVINPGVSVNSPTFTREGLKAIALKACEAIGIPRDKWTIVTNEIDASTLNLSEKHLELIVELVIKGGVDRQQGLELLKQVGLVPEGFQMESSPTLESEEKLETEPDENDNSED